MPKHKAEQSPRTDPATKAIVPVTDRLRDDQEVDQYLETSVSQMSLVIKNKTKQTLTINLIWSLLHVM